MAPCYNSFLLFCFTTVGGYDLRSPHLLGENNLFYSSLDQLMWSSLLLYIFNQLRNTSWSANVSFISLTLQSLPTESFQASNLSTFCCRTPLKIKIQRLENVLEFVKWMFFSTCLGLCIWKVADSFVTFGAKEVGTKIDIKYNHETDLPGFAICRHPNQILG